MHQIDNAEKRQWRILLVYNLYRVFSAFLFSGVYFFSALPIFHVRAFLIIVSSYFIAALVFLYLGLRQRLGFIKQVFCSGTIDILALAAIVLLIGNVQLGQGILLNVAIAALSILAPGRLAIFFAALASFLLLGGGVLQLLMSKQGDFSVFYYSGVYGVSFFATALTAWYLSNRVRYSERLAQLRSDELAGMQRINEYIVERLHSGIIYVDEHKRIKLINTAAREFFGLKERSSIILLIDVSKALAAKMDDFMIQSKKARHIAQTMIKKPFLRVHFFITSVANTPEILIILEDMTFIAQQAQQLKLAALGRFSASIAHELRNPLGAIAHAAQLLGEENELNAEDARLRQLIVNNCGRMNEVIKNVLQLSRREQSQPQVNELNALLRHFKEHFYHNNQCDIIIKVPKKKVTIIFDRSQLEQVLIILCDNAILHGCDKTTGIARIVLSAQAVHQRVTITVSDSGPGVSTEYRESIFEPFFTTLRQGNGMGLFIARDLCEMNQAQLSLLDVSKGCSFAIIQNPLEELLL